MNARTNPELTEKEPDRREIVRYEQPEESLTSVSSHNPIQVIRNATEIAKELKNIIQDAKLTQKISGRDFVKVEGWTSMLAMLGVNPILVSNNRIDREDEVAYEATVELQSRDGNIIGRGEAICSNSERNWKNRDEYAIKSMAATRATGKAARLSFSWIMTLAGYDPTPAEEMPVYDNPSKSHAGVSDPSEEKSKSNLSRALKKIPVAKDWQELEQINLHAAKLFNTGELIKADLDKISEAVAARLEQLDKKE